LTSVEQQKHLLCAPSIQCSKAKGLKHREDQYRLAFVELAEYLKNYSSYSDKHADILNYFLAQTGQQMKTPKIEMMDTTISVPTTTAIHPLPVSIDHPIDSKPKHNWKPKDKINLHDYFIDQYKTRWQNWRDFNSRITNTPLYHDMLDKK